MSRGAILLVVLLILSGCAGSDNPQDVNEATKTTETAIPPTESPTRTTTSPTPEIETTIATTSTHTATPKPIHNPWRKEPIVIGIDQPSDTNKNYTKHVIQAVEYWDENAEGHTSWTPVFVVRANAESPDIEIRFVSKIDRCGVESGGITIGCAPVLSADSTARQTELVRVNMGLTNASTYRVIRHELGHVLGLEHGEGPGDVMAPYDRVYDQVIRVNLQFETTATHEQRDTRRQLWYALEYYSGGADGLVNEDVEFAVIEDRSDADIVIEVNRAGSESRAFTDERQVIVEVNGISLDKRGWHIGYWLGFYFGATSTSELPPPFDEPNADPRVGWWE